MVLPYLRAGVVEVGTDEVGRGCLAGPVVAGAVILPNSYVNSLLQDSKKLKRGVRDVLEVDIKRHAVCWAVAEVDNVVIDDVNIVNASLMAMHRAIDMLPVVPECILVDGNVFKEYGGVAHECIVGGDGKFASIAAASVLAKNYRDNLMFDLSVDYPEYGWDTNVGYPTRVHRCAVRRYGLTRYHRRTFCSRLF